MTQMGYPFEKYKLQTPDRFTLGLERIPYSKNRDRTIGKPVLLVHGLFMSSNVYVLTNNSLGKQCSITHQATADFALDFNFWKI